MSENKITEGLSRHLPAPEGIGPGEAFSAPTGSIVPSTTLFKEPQRVSIVSAEGSDDPRDIPMLTTTSLDRESRWSFDRPGAIETVELNPGELVSHTYLGVYTARLEGTWTAEDPESGRVFFEPVADASAYTTGPLAGERSPGEVSRRVCAAMCRTFIASDFTTDSLAERTGSDPARIVAVMAGTSPYVSELADLAAAFGVLPSDWFEGASA